MVAGRRRAGGKKDGGKRIWREGVGRSIFHPRNERPMQDGDKGRWGNPVGGARAGRTGWMANRHVVHESWIDASFVSGELHCFMG